jgi:hypothetical protein
VFLLTALVGYAHIGQHSSTGKVTSPIEHSRGMDNRRGWKHDTFPRSGDISRMLPF